MSYPVDRDLCYLREPFGTTKGRDFPHTGDDWARRKDVKTPAHLPVLAAYAGVVVDVRWHAQAGRRIILDYQDGIYGVYGHLDRFDVQHGQRVAERQQIGLLGGSGIVSGPHLHYAEYTSLDRARSGIVTYWKGVKITLATWARVSGLTRPNYERRAKAGHTLDKETLMSWTDDQVTEALDRLRAIDARTDAIRNEQLEEDGLAQATRKDAAAAHGLARETRDALLAPRDDTGGFPLLDFLRSHVQALLDRAR